MKRIAEIDLKIANDKKQRRIDEMVSAFDEFDTKYQKVMKSSFKVLDRKAKVMPAGLRPSVSELGR